MAALMSVLVACALVPVSPARAASFADSSADALEPAAPVAATASRPATIATSLAGDLAPTESGEGEIGSMEPEDDSEVAPSGSYDTDIKDANRFQLVLVVRFAGDTTGDGATGLNASRTFGGGIEWDGLFEQLNGFSDNPHLAPTLYSYLKDVSDGACRMRSIAPQVEAATGRIRYLTLPKARDSYAYPVQVVEDALAAFNAAYPDFDGAALDGDGDSFADNVLVVPEVGGAAPAIGSPLWPHKGDFTGSGKVGSQGRAIRVGSYTMISTAHLLSTGTIVHETLHAFGAKDLYRAGARSNDVGNRPVGVWDIMAEHAASRLMRPLAITRQDCGWTTLSESKGGPVTLHAPGSGKLQAVKFKTDVNASEYFVAEFRQAAPAEAGLSSIDMSVEGLPSTIGGSGLIVYRVNPVMKTEGNGNKGEKDYVYVFRSGETGAPRGDGGGDVRHAQLSARGRSSIGVADMNAGLLDGALTYSDGQNSGAVIRVTAQDGDSITFDLKLPDAEELGLWKDAVDAQGSTPLTGTGYEDTTLVTAPDGAIYQICGRLNGADVYRYDGSIWTKLGEVGSGHRSFQGIVYRNELYVAGVRYGSSTTIGLWRWTGRAWATVASVEAQANEPALGVVAGRLYLFADGSGDAARLFALDGTTLRQVGNSLKGVQVAGAHVFEVDGEPAVMLGNFASNDNRTMQYRLVSGAWKAYAVHDGCAQMVDGCQKDGRTFALTVTAEEDAQGGTGIPAGRVRLIDLSETDGASSIATLPIPSAFAASLTLKDDFLYVASVEQRTQIARVYRASVNDTGTWSQIGAAVVTPSEGIDVAILGGAVLVASRSSSSDPVILRQFGEVGEGAITSNPPLEPLPPSLLQPTVPEAPSTSGGSSTSGNSSASGGSSAGSKPASSAGSSTASRPSASTSAKSSSSTAGKKPATQGKAQSTLKPKATSFTKVRGARRAVFLAWKKQTKNVTGYQIRLSTSKKFAKKATKTVWAKSVKKTSLTVKKLKAKKTYYAQIRTYKTAGGKKLYSSWSKMKKVKTK